MAFYVLTTQMQRKAYERLDILPNTFQAALRASKRETALARAELAAERRDRDADRRNLVRSLQASLRKPKGTLGGYIIPTVAPPGEEV